MFSDKTWILSEPATPWFQSYCSWIWKIFMPVLPDIQQLSLRDIGVDVTIHIDSRTCKKRMSMLQNRMRMFEANLLFRATYITQTNKERRKWSYSSFGQLDTIVPARTSARDYVLSSWHPKEKYLHFFLWLFVHVMFVAWKRGFPLKICILFFIVRLKSVLFHLLCFFGIKFNFSNPLSHWAPRV